MSLTNASPLEAAKAARLASRKLAILPTAARNECLTVIHDALKDARDEILAANARDLELAFRAAENGELSQSLVDWFEGKGGKGSLPSEWSSNPQLEASSSKTSKRKVSFFYALVSFCLVQSFLLFSAMLRLRAYREFLCAVVDSCSLQFCPRP